MHHLSRQRETFAPMVMIDGVDFGGDYNSSVRAGVVALINLSPATTTRSNLGFQLSPRVRVSKIVMRKPARALQCEQRKRNCKS
jgi:hypothetical protein